MKKNYFKEKQVERFADNMAVLSAEMVEKANSGHPGAPMGMARMLSELFLNHLRFNPSEPQWPNRDRFVLSAGHASAALYSLLHLVGYKKMSMKELKKFRQFESLTPGHPEYDLSAGVEMSTGPLGQGISTAVGMALGEKIQSNRFEDVIDHYVYVMASEGDLMEGVTYEASSLAGHLKLGNLIVLVDRNHVTIDGKAELSFSENISERFEAQGWEANEIDGTSVQEVRKALQQARQQKDKPSVIICRSHIGWRSSKEDSSSAHGAPLGENVLATFKEKLGYDPQKTFVVTKETKEIASDLKKKNKKYFTEWKKKEKAMDKQKREDFSRRLERDRSLLEQVKWPSWKQGEKLATRKASGEILEALLPVFPEMVGGSADLTPSNNTQAADITDISPGDFSGRYIRWGIREHAMGTIINGLALYGGIRPYGGTFLVFSDYMRPSIRLAALMDIPSIFVFTHDSIGLGEDGPTHQPVEHLMSLRAIPNLQVIRPADANETALAWQIALETQGPTCIILTRQSVEVVTQPSKESFESGAYVVRDVPKGEEAFMTLIASGSEVPLAVESSKVLAEEDGLHVRVISLPIWSRFEEQDFNYIQEVLGDSLIASIEAGSPLGWGGYSDVSMGVGKFGISAPGEEVMKAFGFSVDGIIKMVRGVYELRSESDTDNV